jgi:alpha-D-xyloside xylohydrolase
MPTVTTTSAGRVAATGVMAIGLMCSAPASAKVAATAGSFHAVVGENPWSLTLKRGGSSVLAEYSGSGAGPSGPLGFRTRDGAWHHATRALASARHGGAYTATLATDDPSHRIAVRIARAGDGVISLDAQLLGPTSGVDALGIGFRAPAGERYLGFGERSNAVDQRGNVVEDYTGEGPFQPNERPIIPAVVPNWGVRPRDDATYFPMPWLLSTSGYGVLVDNTDTSYFRLGSDRPDAWSLEVTTAPPDRPESLSGPPPTSLSLRFFDGPRPADVLRRLTEAIGRQPPPEPWYLGPWFQASGDEAAETQRLRDADSPASVIQTYTHYLPCGAQQGNTAAQRERTARLHALGYAVTTYFNPMICTSYSPVYGEAAAAGALTRNPLGQPYVYRYNQFTVSQFDFSSPTGRAIYSRLLGEAVADGYDGWMEDFGEYSPLDALSADGTPGTLMHNRYPVDYHCAADDGTRELRPLLRFIRSGYTGAARCAPVVWGGDPTTDWGFDGLRSAVQNGLSMGLSGVGVWGSDIGGFFSLFEHQLSPELLTRWVQFGAVSGVMRNEADGFAAPPKSRPQPLDADQFANWRRYSKLRTELYPYVRAAAADYRRSGMPIMRQLSLAYPDDPRATAREDQFLFGPDLLAAPVLEPEARQRSLYLPGGDWVDLWRSVEYRQGDGGLTLDRAALLGGGRDVTLPAPLDQLPLLARAGALLPLLPPDVDTLAPYGNGPGLVHLRELGQPLELIAFPHGESSAGFLEDGELRSSEQPGHWRLEIRDSERRTWNLQAAMGTLEHPFHPCSIALDGHRLSKQDWSYSPAGQVLRIRFETDGGRLVVSGRGC